MGKLLEGLIGLGVVSFILHETKRPEMPNYYAMTLPELLELREEQREKQNKRWRRRRKTSKPYFSWNDDDDDENDRSSNQSDAEKEIFRAFPLPNEPASTKNGSKNVVSLQCQCCNARMEMSNNTQALFCPHCGAKNLIVEDSNVKIARERYAAYRDVELGKQRTYERIVASREKKRGSKGGKITSESRDMIVGLAIIFMMTVIVFPWDKLSGIFGGGTKKESHKNEIQIPVAYSEYVGDEYTTVVYALKSAGFTNVNMKGLNDLKLGILNKDGTVDKVYINGNTKFSAQTWFPADAEVLVTYHCFKPD